MQDDALDSAHVTWRSESPHALHQCTATAESDTSVTNIKSTVQLGFLEMRRKLFGTVVFHAASTTATRHLGQEYVSARLSGRPDSGRIIKMKIQITS